MSEVHTQLSQLRFSLLSTDYAVNITVLVDTASAMDHLNRPSAALSQFVSKSYLAASVSCHLTVLLSASPRHE